MPQHLSKGAKTDNRRPSDVIRRRLREVRDGQGLTREKLSDRLEAIGYPIEALTLARIEGGRIKRLSVDDVFALAYALDVSPLFLMLPYGGKLDDYDGQTVWLSDTTVEIAANVPPVGSHMLRWWLRGRETLPGQDSSRFNRELPPDELESLRAAAAAVEIGLPSPPGAVRLRNEQVEAGEAAEPSTWRKHSEAVSTVRAKSDAEVLEELGITTFDEQTAEAAAEAGIPLEQFRAERLELLRGVLLQEYHEAALHRRRRTTRKEQQ
jgi:transcriptional regulator with XRE-family HTH domain